MDNAIVISNNEFNIKDKHKFILGPIESEKYEHFNPRIKTILVFFLLDFCKIHARLRL